MIKLIDTHCHLTDSAFDLDRSFLIRDLSNFGLEKVVLPSINLCDSKKSLELANEYENIFALVGVHPENLDDFKENDIEELRKLAKNPKVVGIGEIGLDYYWREDNKDEQKNLFIKQLELARELNLPAVVHSRNSRDDVYEILKKFSDLKIQVHCFADDLEMLKKYMDLGFYISIGGVVTYKNSTNEKETAKNVILERLMLETDSPYLTPEPYRGSRNDPRKIIEVARTIAEIRGMKLSKLIKNTTKNAERFFDI